MTTGTIEPYLNQPEDINPPRPSYLNDVFHLVSAYIELLKHVPPAVMPGRGLIKLYGQRMGVLEPDTTVIEAAYLALTLSDKSQRQKLQVFAQSAIAYNLTTLYQLLTNTMSRDLARAFGDGACLSGETARALNQFASFADEITRGTDRARQARCDSMDALVSTCHYNATYPRGGEPSSETIIRAIATLDQIVAQPQPVETVSSARDRLLNALKIVFYIGCRYYRLNMLRFSDETIRRSYDRQLRINDLTLAAIPFEPSLIYACEDDAGSITRWGVEYVQSLEAVLLYFGSVRYSALTMASTNGNEGVLNHV